MRFIYLLIVEADLELEEFLAQNIMKLINRLSTISFVSGLELVNTIMTNLQIGRWGGESLVLSKFQLELNAIQDGN